MVGQVNSSSQFSQVLSWANQDTLGTPAEGVLASGLWGEGRIMTTDHVIYTNPAASDW